jgi:hypothetical protein
MELTWLKVLLNGQRRRRNPCRKMMKILGMVTTSAKAFGPYSWNQLKQGLKKGTASVGFSGKYEV